MQKMTVSCEYERFAAFTRSLFAAQPPIEHPCALFSLLYHHVVNDENYDCARILISEMLVLSTSSLPLPITL